MRPAKMITIKRTPGRLFDVIGSRFRRPHKIQLRHKIPIGNSSIPSVSCKTSLILLSHHLRPASPNIFLYRRKFSTSLPMSSLSETSPSIADSTKADNMDPNTSTMDVDAAVLGYETWYPTILALREAIRSAFPSSPRPIPTSSKEEILEFNTYWRGVFKSLHREVESDESIPRFLATPPLKNFEINIFTENSGLDCPCCLPDVEPANIVLENGAGLTKGDLIVGVGRYLYGLELDPTSSLVVNGTGGVDQKAGDLLPVIESEYEITIKSAYPPYLVREGDRERTFEQEVANEDRPLGGWPMGGGLFSDLETSSEAEQEHKEEPETETELSDLYGNASVVTENETTEDPRQETKPDPVSTKLGQLELGDRVEVVDETEKESSHTTSAGDEGKGQTDPVSDTNPVDEPNDNGNSEPPCIEIEDAPGVYKFPAVIYDYSWMSGCSEGPNGEKEIYAHWTEKEMPPVARIWLFVCPPEVFEERVEGAKTGQENGDRFYNAGGEKDSNDDKNGPSETEQEDV